MATNFESQLQNNHYAYRNQKSLTIEAEPDEEHVEAYMILRHKYLQEQEEQKKEKKRKERQEANKKHLEKAKEGSKMPANRQQYISFLRGITANENIRREEEKSAKEQRFNLKLQQQTLKGTWGIAPMQSKNISKSVAMGAFVNSLQKLSTTPSNAPKRT